MASSNQMCTDTCRRAEPTEVSVISADANDESAIVCYQVYAIGQTDSPPFHHARTIGAG